MYGPVEEMGSDDWILLLDDSAIIIRGLPEFLEDKKLSLAPSKSEADDELSSELAEIEGLLKSA